jgi:CBS domain containing-hemolysin-like protein
MTLLFIYLAIALGFSFVCSVAESVILSVSMAHIGILEKKKSPSAQILRHMKQEIDKPLAAILTLNTVAHTAGAAGVGAEATRVFGNQYLGLVSAILTLLILVFSEIIPKTLGTVYWRQLAAPTAYFLKYLVIVLAPFIYLSRFITSKLFVRSAPRGFNRSEFSAMATLGEEEGQLNKNEVRVLQNLLELKSIKTEDVMTPRTVMFALPASSTVDLFFNKYSEQRFSRIPIYSDSKDNIVGFVLRSDLLTAKARDNEQKILAEYQRPIGATLDKTTLLVTFEQLIQQRKHILSVVDEYGVFKGLITLEDILETLIGLEIVDEQDTTADMQKLARNIGRKRAKQLGVEIDGKRDSEKLL